MSNEIRVTSTLRITKAGPPSVQYNGMGPNSFTADFGGNKGPVPGAINVTVYGTDINLSELVVPAWTEVANQGSTTIDIGIWDSTLGNFYPFMKLLPGWKFTFCLSDQLHQYSGPPGTGTGPHTDVVKVHARSRGPGNGILYFGAFET